MAKIGKISLPKFDRRPNAQILHAFVARVLSRRRVQAEFHTPQRRRGSLESNRVIAELLIELNGPAVGRRDMQLDALRFPASEVALGIGVKQLAIARSAKRASQIKEIDVPERFAVGNLKLEMSHEALAFIGQHESFGILFDFVFEPGEVADIALEAGIVAKSFNAGIATIARDSRRVTRQMDGPVGQPQYVYNHEYIGCPQMTVIATELGPAFSRS